MSEVQAARDIDPESGEKYKSLVRYSKPVVEPKGGKDKKKKPMFNKKLCSPIPKTF